MNKKTKNALALLMAFSVCTIAICNLHEVLEALYAYANIPNIVYAVSQKGQLWNCFLVIPVITALYVYDAGLTKRVRAIRICVWAGMANISLYGAILAIYGWLSGRFLDGLGWAIVSFGIVYLLPHIARWMILSAEEKTAKGE